MTLIHGKVTQKKTSRELTEVAICFLKSLYYLSGLHKFSREVEKDYKFTYNLCGILSMLIVTRILDPSSKRSSLEIAKYYLKKPNYPLYQIYRALEVLALNNDYLQA